MPVTPLSSSPPKPTWAKGDRPPPREENGLHYQNQWPHTHTQWFSHRSTFLSKLLPRINPTSSSVKKGNGTHRSPFRLIASMELFWPPWVSLKFHHRVSLSHTQNQQLCCAYHHVIAGFFLLFLVGGKEVPFDFENGLQLVTVRESFGFIVCL